MDHVRGTILLLLQNPDIGSPPNAGLEDKADFLKDDEKMKQFGEIVYQISDACYVQMAVPRTAAVSTAVCGWWLPSRSGVRGRESHVFVPATRRKLQVDWVP